MQWKPQEKDITKEGRVKRKGRMRGRVRRDGEEGGRGGKGEEERKMREGMRGRREGRGEKGEAVGSGMRERREEQDCPPLYTFIQNWFGTLQPIILVTLVGPLALPSAHPAHTTVH